MTENFAVRTWQTTPIVTRSIALLSLTISLLVYIKAISPFYLSYSTFYMKKLQLWRVITCFFYFGPINLDTVLHIVFMCRYSKMLEEGFLHTSEYFYLLLFCMSFIFSLSLYLKVSVLGSALSSTITYIWTRKNPNTHVQLLGCVIFPAFYLPFVVPIFSFLSERKVPLDDVMGILVGHVYYYLKYVYPRVGNDILRTPNIIKRLFGEEIQKVDTNNHVQNVASSAANNESNNTAAADITVRIDNDETSCDSMEKDAFKLVEELSDSEIEKDTDVKKTTDTKRNSASSSEETFEIVNIGFEGQKIDEISTDNSGATIEEIVSSEHVEFEYWENESNNEEASDKKRPDNGDIF